MSSPSTYFFWQKGIAFLLLFSFFFTGVVTPVPFVQAAASPSTSLLPVLSIKKPRNNLVAILVQKSLLQEGSDINPATLSGKIYRYAEDIRTHLQNTKALILSVDPGVTPVNIADTLEKFYFDGDVNEFEENHLSGVVLIGDIPKPQVYFSENLPEETLAPYLDFEDKAVLYMPKTQRFEPSGKDFRPEVWHGVIPNFASLDQLSKFFDDDHDYYSGVKKVKKEVLYTDFIAESKALNSSQYDLYLNTQKYAEDIAYKRFTGRFLNGLMTAFQGTMLPVTSAVDQQLQAIQDAAKQPGCLWGVVPKFESFLKNNPTLTGAAATIPDIYSVFDMQKFLPEYGKVVQSYIQKIYQNVGYSGRWGQNDVEYFAKDVTLRDVEMREKLKYANEIVKNAFTNYVDKNWQKPVAVPVTLNKYTVGIDGQKEIVKTYDNAFYGVNAKDIKTSYQCSWLRGTQTSSTDPVSQLTEFNRTYDVNALTSAGYAGCSAQNRLTPGKCVPQSATSPVLSVSGSMVNTTAQAASYKNCLAENWRGFTGDRDSPDLEVVQQKISSVFVHNEPTDDTINKEIASKFTQSLPVDAVPYIDFQNSKDEYQRINFPNIFKSASTGQFFLIQAAKNIQILQKKEGIATIPDDFFLKLFPADFLKELDVWIAWNNFSVSQKYHFLTLTNAFQSPVSSDKRELHYLRGKMNNGNLFLNIDPNQNSRKDLMLDLWRKQAAQSTSSGSQVASGTDTNSTSASTNLDLTQKCGSYEGVDIWQWPAAVTCWLNNLKTFKIIDTQAFQHSWSDSIKNFTNGVDSFQSQLDSFSQQIKNNSQSSTSSASSQAPSSSGASPWFTPGVTQIGDAQKDQRVLTSFPQMIRAPEKMTLVQSSTKNGIHKHVFTVQLLVNSQQLFSGLAQLDVALPSGVQTDAEDIDTQKSGLQIAVIQGLASMNIWIANPINGSIEARYSDQILAKTQINSVASPKIQVNVDSIKNDSGFSSAKLNVHLDQTFFGDLPVFFGGDSRIVFYQKSTTMHDGYLEMPVVFQTSRDPISISISSPFIGAFTFQIPAQNQVPAKFLTDSDEFYVQSGQTFPLKIQIVDAFLEPVKASTPFTMYVTPTSNKFTDTKSQTLTAVNGLATINVGTFTKNGDIHLMLTAPGMESKIITLRTGVTIEPKNIKNSNAVFTFFAQEGDGNADDFIHSLLQSGSLAVAQKAPSSTLSTAQFILSPNGNFQILDPNLAVEDGGGFQLRLVNKSSLEHYLTWKPKFDPDAKVSATDKTADVFINNTSGQLIQVSTTNDIFMDGEKLAHIGPDGVEVFDNRLNKTFFFENGRIIAQISYDGTPILSTEFSTVGYDIISQSSLVKKQGDKLVLGLTGNSAETHPDGVGWADNDISVLESAARMPFGQAFMSDQKMQDVFWGDPALSYRFLSDTLTKTKYEPTVGDVPLTDKEDLKNLQNFDYNGDNIDDMVMRKNEDTLVLLEGTENGNFIKRGDYGLAADGISQIETGDFMGDGFDDILVASMLGKVYFFNNEKGHISPETTAFLTNAHEINQMQVEDFDGDKIKDIVLATSRGELIVFYGTKTGFEKQSHLIVSYGINLNRDNAGTDVQVTDTSLSPDMEVMVASTKYVVSAFADMNGDGIKDLSLIAKAQTTTSQNGITVISTSDANQIIAYGSSNGTFVSNKILVYGSNGVALKSVQVHIPDKVFVPMKTADSYLIKPLPLKSVPGATKYYSSPDRNSLDIDSLVYVDIVIPRTSLKKGEYVLDTLPKLFTFVTGTATCNNQSCASQMLQSKQIAIGPITDITKDLHIRYQAQVKQTPRIPFNWNATTSELEIPKVSKKYVPSHQRIWTEKDIPAETVPAVTMPATPDLSTTVDTATQKAWGLTLNQSGKSEQILGLEDKLKNAIDFLQTLNCQKGSCFNLPINKAFLVPGMWGVAPSLLSAAKGTDFFSGLAQGVNNTLDRIGLPLAPNLAPTPVFGLKSVFCPAPNGAVPMILPCFGQTCYQEIPLGPCWSNPASYNFRTYLSPTLTGGMGMAMCTGPASLKLLQTTQSMIPQCAAFALPMTDFIPACNMMSQSITDTFQQASNTYSDGTARARTLFNVDGIVKVTSPDSVQNYQGLTIGINTFEQLLDKDDLQNDSTYPFFKSLFIRWWDAQKSQFAKLLMLPTITLYYPDMKAVMVGGEDDVGQEIKSQNALIPKLDQAIKKMKNQQGKESGVRSQEQGGKRGTAGSSPASNPASYSGLSAVQTAVIDPAGQKMDAIKNSLASTTGDIGNKFQSVFDLIENVPFLVVERKAVDIDLPWINPMELNSIINSLDRWLQDNEGAINRFIKQVTSIQEKCKNSGLVETKRPMAIDIPSVTVCEKALGITAAVDLQQLLSTVRQDLQILKEYRDYPQTLAKYKTQLSYYFVDALRYVNSLVNALGGWLDRNHQIAEKYMILYYTVTELINSWEKISLVFTDYTQSCDSCKADVYSQNFNLQNILFGFIPTPPVVVFPRWPDVILDLSHVQMGIKIIIPEIHFHAREVFFHFDLQPIRLPELDFQVSLDFGFNVPQIPLLPKLPPLPDLPNFPSLPLIQLPDLPPPPRLPKLLDCIGDWADLVRLVLKVYCLITNGLWVYPESELTQVIESLTNRSSAFMRPIDFLQVQWPDMTYPWVDSINVDGYLNVQPKTDALSKPVEKIAQDINKVSADTISSVQNGINNSLNGVVNSINKSVQSVNQGSDNLEQQNQKLLQDINQKSQKLQNAGKTSYIGPYKTFDEMYQALSPEHKRRVHSLTSPSLNAYQKLSETLLKASKQEFSDAQIIAGTGDISHSREFARAKDYQLAGNTVSSSSQELTLQQNAAFSSIQQNAVQSTTPEQGMFIYDKDTKIKEKVVNYAPQSASISSMRFFDYEQDKDSDIVYTARNKLFLKKNYEKDTPQKVYPYAAQIGDLAHYLPQKRAVNGIAVNSENAQTDIAWLADEELDNAGYLLEKKRFVNGYDVHYSTPSEYIFLLKDSLFTTEQSFLGNSTIPLGTKNFVLKDGEKAQILPFHTESFTWSMPNDFYYFRMHAIKNTGDLSTVSQQFLLSPQMAYDKDAPLVFENNTDQVPVLKDWPISAGKTDDASDTEYFWDINRDGKNDYAGDMFTYPAQEVLGQRTIDMTARDTAGNARAYTKTVNVYAPTPSITNATNSEISGSISPKIPAMPFALLRKRDGKISLITPDNGKRFYTDAQGNFSIQKNPNHSGIMIRDGSGGNIALVQTSIGYIQFFDKNYHFQAYPATQSSPTRLGILDQSGTMVSSVAFTISPRSVRISNALDASVNDSIQVFDANPRDDLKVVSIPSTARYFSNGVAVLGANNEVFAAISEDGSIRLINPNLSLSAEQNDQNKHIVFIIQKDGKAAVKVDLGEIDTAAVAQARESESPRIVSQGDLVRSSIPNTRDEVESLRSSWLSRLWTRDYGLETVYAAEVADAPLSGIEKAKKTLTIPFKDLNPNHPFYQAIIDLYKRNILKGYDDGSFHPDSQISRAEFVKIALGATTCFDCSSPTEETKAKFAAAHPFPDVNLADWFYYCISIAKKEKMVTGYGDGQFHPDKNISRKEAAAILLRQIKAPLEIMPKGYFRDVPDYDWAKDYVYTAVQLGIIKNTGGFTVPNEEITRGEFAMMASRILEMRACQMNPAYQDTHPTVVGKLPEEAGSEKIPANAIRLNDGTIIAPQADGTVKIQKPDGTVIVTRPDGSLPPNSTAKPSDVLPAITEFAGVCTGFKNNLCPVLPETFHPNTPIGIFVSPAPSSPETQPSTQPGTQPSTQPTKPVQCIFVDQLADILPGDIISAIILSSDDKIVFSKSNEVVVK